MGTTEDEEIEALLAEVESDLQQEPRERTPLEKMSDRPPALDAGGQYMEKLDLEELIKRNMAAIQRVWRSASWEHAWRVHPMLKRWLKDQIEQVLNDFDGLRSALGEPSITAEVKHWKKKGATKFILWGRKKMIEEAQKHGIGLTRKTTPIHWGADAKKIYADYGKDGARKKNEPGTEMTMIDFAAWTMQLTREDYDVQVCFDNPRFEFLTLGTGKSTKASHYCHIVDKHFDLSEDVVYKDDYPKFWELLYDRQKFRARLVDEAQWFIDAKRANTREAREIQDELKSMREHNQIWVWCTPVLYDTIPYFREERCMFRVCVSRRGEAQLYMKGGIMDEDEDKWGIPAASWYGIDDMPQHARKIYNENRRKAGERLRRKRVRKHTRKGRKVA